MPRVRARNSPALLQWREAFRPLWPCLHCAGPPRPRRGQSGFEGVMVLRRIRNNRDETRNIVRLDGAEEERGRDPLIQTGAGHEDGDQSPQRLHPQMPLAPCDVLAAILPALRAPALGGLDRWALHARGTGGGSRPASPRVRSRHALTIVAPVPSSRHRGKSSETVLWGSQSCGSLSHWPPLRFRETIVLRTSRLSPARGCPPRGLCLAGGSSGATMAHCASVRSEGYFFRDWSFFNIRAPSSADGICAHYLTNILFCQALFPDSLRVHIRTRRLPHSRQNFACGGLSC